MKTLKEAFINKNTIKNISFNKFDVTKKDLIGDIKDFPLGIVVRMLKETEKQGNEPDIKEFQRTKLAGFDWCETEDGFDFWDQITDGYFDEFYKKYPEYKKYDK